MRRYRRRYHRHVERRRPVTAALDEQLAAMSRATMRRAQRQKIPDHVQAAIRAMLDVVDVDKHRVGAAGSLAAVPITIEHGAT
jgi:hypothetical protein